jgi:hypothetical protein
MNDRFDPEQVDLAVLALDLRRTLGNKVLGAVVGRTLLRDEVVRRLRCSLLAGETLVDTMIGRGFVRQRQEADGLIVWELSDPSPDA